MNFKLMKYYYIRESELGQVKDYKELFIIDVILDNLLMLRRKTARDFVEAVLNLARSRKDFCARAGLEPF